MPSRIWRRSASCWATRRMTSDLAARSLAFAVEIANLLYGTLPGDRTIVSVRHNDRCVVRPDGDQPRDRRIPLTVSGQHLAELSIALYQTLDREGVYLKTCRTDFEVFSKLDRTPLVRLEYLDDMRSDPICHWQFHAERGAFTHLLSIANAAHPGEFQAPHDLSKLHLPVGGERFRPSLEDVIEFLIVDCGIDHKEGWRAVIQAGRERWRRRQLRAAVRDLQEEAAEILIQYGWSVTPPAIVAPEHLGPYRKW